VYWTRFCDHKSQLVTWELVYLYRSIWTVVTDTCQILFILYEREIWTFGSQQSSVMAYTYDKPQDKRLFSSPQRITSITTGGYLCQFHTVKGLKREAEHSSQSGSEVTNIWSHVSSPHTSSLQIGYLRTGRILIGHSFLRRLTDVKFFGTYL
jgi:hypothetical protein